MSAMMPKAVTSTGAVTDGGVVARETAEQAVRQVVANGRLEGAPDPSAQEEDELLAVARGERTADEVIASFGRRYG
jgi:hypothetical protein